MNKRSSIVTLLTDFGSTDAFVASMKGVILGILPRAVIIDISHEIPPHDLRRAAQVLEATIDWFPSGTVHVVVIDPGVGTNRAALAIDAGRATFVGPDNGVFGPALAKLGDRNRAYLIERRWRPTPSATFHGRDLFAPAGAEIAGGAAPKSMGRRILSLHQLPWAVPQRKGNQIVGEVAFVDHFGNLVTNIDADMLRGPRDRCEIRIGRRRIRGITESYGHAGRGRLLALVESTGHVEVALREGSAAARLQARAGTVVRVVEAG